MRVLIDTNLLTRLVSPTPADTHAIAEDCYESLLKAFIFPCIVPQCLYEF